MINTILFDLDGTILPMDINKFLKTYFYELGLYLKDIIDPNLLIKYVADATEQTVRNTEYIKNEEIFMNRFVELAGGKIEDFNEIFLSFYNSTFSKVQKETSVSLEIVESIKILKDKGYTVAIATNPLFPLVANHHRIRWAGLKPEDFSYISCFEENYYCKPHLLYYEEVLNAVGKTVEECLMVGNDVSDDLAVSKLGVKTFLIENHMINNYNEDIHSDYQGDYKDFLKFVKALPKL